MLVEDEGLVVSCHPFTPFICRKDLDELIFEVFRFGSCSRLHSSFKGSSIVVDSGFSSTTITPVYNSVPINYGIRKLSIGGKILTNFLKEQISFRHFDLTEETWLVNLIKEQLCYFAVDFYREMEEYHLRERENIFCLPENNTVTRISQGVVEGK